MSTTGPHLNKFSDVTKPQDDDHYFGHILEGSFQRVYFLFSQARYRLERFCEGEMQLFHGPNVWLVRGTKAIEQHQKANL